MEQNRILNLDLDDTIQVTLGGREYILRQQRRAIIERVVRAVKLVEDQMFAEDDSGKERTGEENLALVFGNWDQAFPAFALMLGVEPSDANYQDTLNHLTEHLTFPKAHAIFNAWYDLNQVRRFFIYLGNPLIPQAEFDQALDMRRSELAGEVEAAVTAAVN